MSVRASKRPARCKLLAALAAAMTVFLVIRTLTRSANSINFVYYESMVKEMNFSFELPLLGSPSINQTKLSTESASKTNITQPITTTVASESRLQASKLLELLADESWVNASKNPYGVTEIKFFNDTAPGREQGFGGCLKLLEDSIRLAEWFPYHYAILPLRSVVIALDPANSEKGTDRVLQLIDLWKDKMEITLWPNFVLPAHERLRPKVPLHRETQVYFAKQCLIHHKIHNHSWTLETDNDELLMFNHIHSDDQPETDYYPKDQKFRQRINEARNQSLLLRKTLPSIADRTIMSYLEQHEFPRCVRLPMLLYGGGQPSPSFSHNGIINVTYLASMNNINNGPRHGEGSKVMIDVSRVSLQDLEQDRARTIHNPNRRVCGDNGKWDSGADYIAAVFRLNHYLGSVESFLERNGDFRGRSVDSYMKRQQEFNTSGDKFDLDIISWFDVFVNKVGQSEAQRLVAPLVEFTNEERVKQAAIIAAET